MGVVTAQATICFGLGRRGGGADEEVESPPPTSAEAAGAEGRGCLALEGPFEGDRAVRFWGCVDMVEETQAVGLKREGKSTSSSAEAAGAEGRGCLALACTREGCSIWIGRGGRLTSVP